MTNRTIASIGMAGVLASVALLGGTAFETGRAVANRVGSGGDVRAAQKAADEAARALKKKRVEDAVRYAETAVQLMPGEAGYRALLGRAYLAAGRFESARTALIDALSIDGQDGTAALNLSLAQIATGDWTGARATLTEHQDTIPAKDRGLAIALAGDPAAAVELLQTAAHAPGADATTRQNLALALALAGRWAEAKVVAAMDVPGDELNDRMMQWVAFAQPRGAADQVAALLGVTPVLDAGQPSGLALTATPGVATSAADPVDAYMPGTPGVTETAAAPAEVPAEVTVAAATVAAPEAVAETAPAPEVMAAAVQVAPRVIFAPRREIVQPLPLAPLARPAVRMAQKGTAPAMLAKAGAERAVRQPGRPENHGAARAAAPASGNWVVQLGAYHNAAIAQERWTGLARRVRVLAAHQPHGGQAKINGASYYRLSVGGFARMDAIGMCAEVRRAGGRCFVRQDAGDKLAAWAKPLKATMQPVRTAARRRAKGVEVASR